MDGVSDSALPDEGDAGDGVHTAEAEGEGGAVGEGGGGARDGGAGGAGLEVGRGVDLDAVVQGGFTAGNQNLSQQHHSLNHYATVV